MRKRITLDAPAEVTPTPEVTNASCTRAPAALRTDLGDFRLIGTARRDPPLFMHLQTKAVGGRDKHGHDVSGYGQTFFGFLPIENVFGSSETNS
jgi:hypothetical protein